ncbi:MAG: CotH kinase family protein [Clostridia bacterium]|nr:CotH kinase family protein [Clostridia bacterium]
MKTSKILSIIILIFSLAMIGAFSASAKVAEKTTFDSFYYIANSENENTVVYPQKAADGSAYIFLPSSADLSELILNSESEYSYITVSADKSVKTDFGEKIDILSLFDDYKSENGEYTVRITCVPEAGTVLQQKITVMKSESVKSLYLASEDPVKEGREWVDTSKSNEAKGEMVFLNADGTVFHEDELTELKARGNSTFTDFVKKAYQIKIGKKTALIGDEKNANKKWVLLANAADITLIHNQLTFALAQDIGLPYTVESEPVDLYYDGEYRGTYLLAEKVEVDKTRVDIGDLDGLIEDINEDIDAYENPVVVTKTTASKGEINAKTDSAGSYKYVQGLIEPELENGTTHHAYLLELDFIYRYPNEQSGFVTNRGQAVVTKNPEYLTKETGAFISQYFQDFEDAVFSPDGYNKATGKYYYEYCDIDSLVNIYLINEFTKNYDSFRSSAFFYLPENEDIMYAGPVWDFDICYGTGYNGNREISANPENFFATTKYMLGTLITIESFRDAVKAKLDKSDGVFYKAVQNMLGEAGYIKTFSDAVFSSQKMNYKLWNINDKVITTLLCTDEVTYENSISFLDYFVSNRIEWLSDITSEWNGEKYSVPTDASFPLTYRYHAHIEKTPAKNATCTTGGNTEGLVCNDCGTVFKQYKELAPKGHSWKDATCNSPKKCSGCGLTEGEALTHEYTPDPGDSRNSETCIVYKCNHCKKVMLITVQPKPKYEKGDINMDSKVNAADARLALRISASLEKLTDEILEIGDMTGDNKLTAADARKILRKSAKLE